jgi:hypothetical protein
VRKLLEKANWRKVSIALLAVCVLSVGVNVMFICREQAARRYFPENILAHLGLLYHGFGGVASNIDDGLDNPLGEGRAVFMERDIAAMDSFLFAFAENHSPVGTTSFWWTTWQQTRRIVEFSDTPADDLRLMQASIYELIVDLSADTYEGFFPAVNPWETSPDFSIRPRAFFERFNVTVFELRHMPHGI